MIEIIAIARQNSTRFPNKIFANIKNKKVIEIIIEKLEKIGRPFIFAIPGNQQNIDLKKYLDDRKIRYFEGSEHNVLSRFVQAAAHCEEEYVQRFNCDNIAFDPMYLIECHKFIGENPGSTLASNTHCKNHSGQSVEIIKRKFCKIVQPPSEYDCEHIFPYFYKNLENQLKLPCPLASVLSLDTSDDLRELKKIIK